jgi:hypothetical protein
VVSALEPRPVNQTSRLPSVTPVLLRSGERRALRCRLPGPPSAFMAQRVSEESEDPKQERNSGEDLDKKGWRTTFGV